MDVHRSRAKCMVHLGDLANKQGHASKAIGFWTTAHPLFERSLQAKDVAQIDARLSTVDKACQKSLLQLITLSAPDRSLNRETHEIHEAETPENVFSTPETTSC
jgi:hypothetical protein